jgi:hypothetical protein
MSAMPTTVLRVSGLAAGGLILVASAGCAGSSHQTDATGSPTGAVQDAAQLMTGGAGHTSIGGVRIDWQHEQDGHVCVDAQLPPHATSTPLGSCIRHLRADQITYALTRLRKPRQLVIVGVKGPRVENVYLRFRDKRWTPAASRLAFFGYVPRGKVLSVVKVLKDGTRREFTVNEYSA